jgi:hypothetical protein
MEKNPLSTIKYESVKDILMLISNRKKISRAHIASETGLSLMTVGKAADSLIDCNIVIQTKEARAAAGRRARLLSLNPLYFGIILDLKQKPFRSYIVNSELKILAESSFAYDTNYDYYENLGIFLKNLRRHSIIKHDMDYCYGTGAVFPLRERIEKADVIISEWYDEIKRAGNNEKKHNKGSNEIICETAVESVIPLLKTNNMKLLYILMGHSPGCAVICDGKSFCSTSFGDIIVQSGKSISEIIQSAEYNDTVINDLAVVIHNIIKILTPDEIIIESALITTSRSLMEDILTGVKSLGISLPVTYEPETPPSIIGLSYLLRQNWFRTAVGQNK